MPNYRITPHLPSLFVIEVKVPVKKWYWFGRTVERWIECNIYGGPYGETFTEEDYPWWFGISKKPHIIPKLSSFRFIGGAEAKLKEFERNAILQSIPKVVE
jgi:hypothetical protein